MTTGDITKALALQEAAEAGDADMVTRLLEAGVSGWWTKQEIRLAFPDVSIQNKESVSRSVLFSLHDVTQRQNMPLYMAAFKGHEQVVDVFLRKKDYDQGTLNTALYGAVVAQALPLVEKLLAAGANPLISDGIILRHYKDGAPEIMTALIAAADKSCALPVVLRMEKADFFQRVLYADEKINLYPALAAVCQALNAHENLFNRQNSVWYLEKLQTMMAFAEVRGDDMGSLIAYVMKQAVKERAAPVIDVLVQTMFPSVDIPHRQELLDLALQSVAGLEEGGSQVAEYGYVGLTEKLLQQGARAQPLLMDAVSMDHSDLALLALKYGADPRMGVVLWSEGMESPAQRKVFPVLSAGVFFLSDKELEFLAGGQGARYAIGMEPEFLRAISVKTQNSGLALAMMCGQGDAAITALFSAETPLGAADMLMADRDGFRVIDHVLRHEGLLKKMLEAKNWHFRLAEYNQVWALLPENVQKQHAEEHRETIGVLQSLQDQRDIRARAASHKNLFRLK